LRKPGPTALGPAALGPARAGPVRTVRPHPGVGSGSWCLAGKTWESRRVTRSWWRSPTASAATTARKKVAGAYL